MTVLGFRSVLWKLLAFFYSTYLVEYDLSTSNISFAAIWAADLGNSIS